ncbi:MarR family transcriptional regulator [Halostagnicola kamekurae]|nr:MarR family transcriptional regulator [Halostagnicola kamekurae]
MTTERRILRHLTERGPLDVVELATALETHPTTVELACERLRDRERVRLVGSSRYRLVDGERAGGVEIDSEPDDDIEGDPER